MNGQVVRLTALDAAAPVDEHVASASSTKGSSSAGSGNFLLVHSSVRRTLTMAVTWESPNKEHTAL